MFVDFDNFFSDFDECSRECQNPLQFTNVRLISGKSELSEHDSTRNTKQTSCDSHTERLFGKWSARSATESRRGRLPCSFTERSGCSARSGKLDRARFRLYRGQILQVNMRLKALAEIYKMHSFAQLCNLIFFKILLKVTLQTFAKLL